MQLYFDECCSRRLAKVIKELFITDYPDLETGHVLDLYNPSTADSTWLEPLKDKSWIPITNDHGYKPKREKLPVVCKQWGITHITISPTIINAGYEEQKEAIISVWGQLLEVHKLPPGTQVRLVKVTAKRNAWRYELQVKGKALSAVLNSN